jgi:hypothetical protein
MTSADAIFNVGRFLDKQPDMLGAVIAASIAFSRLMSGCAAGTIS